MGAWGAGPRDNDTAQDFYLDLFDDEFNEKLFKTIQSPDYYLARSAIDMLCLLQDSNVYLCMDVPVWQSCLDKLHVLRDLTSTDGDGRMFRISVNEQIRECQKHLKITKEIERSVRSNPVRSDDVIDA